MNNILVSIGIPTFNRAILLRRSIESAINQTYKNIEIIISDNSSDDDTSEICANYQTVDSRVKYIRQITNLGPIANFSEVLKYASGQYFMWLGDDDWLDRNYIKECISYIINHKTCFLAHGNPAYYINGKYSYTANSFNLTSPFPWIRVMNYYCNVSDNGMFYGVMPTRILRKITFRKSYGGDWLLISGIIFQGYAKFLNNVTIHRELGGASANTANTVNSLSLPKRQAILGKIYIAVSASREILSKFPYNKRPLYERLFYAIFIFLILFIRGGKGFFTILKKNAYKRIRKKFNISI